VGGTRWTSELNPPEVHSWGALLTPKVGVDFMGQWPRGFAGFGLFGGIPMGGAGEAKGIGLVLGIRAPLGVLVARRPSVK